ncbi:MAG: sensor histidine kinase [Christensenellaceae bacterium]|nr:sensor histidine kinase [Christensenellaceae bacterium]
MKLLIAWLRTYRLPALLILSLLLLFPLTHLLGGGEIRELRYALTLCGVVCLTAAVISLLMLRRRLRMLRGALRHLPEEPSALPTAAQPAEEAWRELTEAYQAQSRELSGRMIGDARETADYYTLWLHQIKTPLAALNLLAQSPGEVDKSLLRQETLKIEQYAAIALDYQRLQSIHNDLHLTHVPLYPLCCQAVRKLRPLFQYGQISLTLSAFEGDALTDAKWLLVVLTQVLTNALKYTPAGGHITITQESPGLLVISDTGIGIRPEDQARVFDRGFTGQTGRGQEKSTGIGLYLCKRICDELGHGISLSSEVGVGTRVALDLRREEWVDLG